MSVRASGPASDVSHVGGLRKQGGPHRRQRVAGCVASSPFTPLGLSRDLQWPTCHC
ncbi:hypothetical protein COLO4_06342 [Corchorus olitorius]|uniref:Uncharacterized protein n=1 Tax=Corchorus olitorius TaxID=93759 RepID=A0A1R3KNB4_9ROSI|nr:hypothetical protein COLO4_06342 [Corchorus olitorius]